MAENIGNELRITDGSTSFEGGVDSAKMTSIKSRENPKGIERNQLAWLTNATVRGGGITPRNGWLKHVYDFEGDDGLFQGAAFYTPDADYPYIMMSVAGHIYRIQGDVPQDRVGLVPIQDYAFVDGWTGGHAIDQRNSAEEDVVARRQSPGRLRRRLPESQAAFPR